METRHESAGGRKLSSCSGMHDHESWGESSCFFVWLHLIMSKPHRVPIQNTNSSHGHPRLGFTLLTTILIHKIVFIHLRRWKCQPSHRPPQKCPAPRHLELKLSHLGVLFFMSHIQFRLLEALEGYSHYIPSLVNLLLLGSCQLHM